jgi:hypothetical protein
MTLCSEDSLHGQPISPRDARQLAETSARLCRLLRDEVAAHMAIRNPALAALAAGWRKSFSAEAGAAQFADGYAQAVTFGLLLARARGITLREGLHRAASELTKTDSLIGAALVLLTESADVQTALKTSLDTLLRVLDAVDWPTIGKGESDAWLYFYEDFLAVYDNELRKQSGSYYTPPEVVETMVRLVDDVLRSRFQLRAGLGSPEVTVVDPAVGTGTFLLGILRWIAGTVQADQGPGAVRQAINSALSRLVAFERQLGPFAVAQLRIIAELADLTGAVPTTTLRMFLTDTLSRPGFEEERRPFVPAPVTVVIGNPPYKVRARGRGGWVESGRAGSPEPPLGAWQPPRAWGLGTHAKHLRNLYVYFWRWATWTAFDQDPDESAGVVCFITAAGFLNGPGFQKMRDYLRRTADEIWVIDCSPEGHQPEANTRIFQGVQQPVCIVLASRSPATEPSVPAQVRFRALPAGTRESKLDALSKLTLGTKGWAMCPSDWRAPFLAKSRSAWGTYPALGDLFVYNGSGVMPGRTWVIAPDAESLLRRWQRLIDAPSDQKELLFHPHLREGQPGDRHSKRVVASALAGHEPRPEAVADERGPCNQPVRYGFRSFDRQWIIPDNRLINQPNPELWQCHSHYQVYLTALVQHSPSAGPAVTFSGLIPDLHHYKGSFGGRVFPLWRDRDASVPNVPSGLLAYLSQAYRARVSAEDLMAYIAAIAAHPGFIGRFANELVQPGLRIPITADGPTFAAAAELGRIILWLHTFGERFGDSRCGRPAQPPRLSASKAPRIPEAGALQQDPGAMPDTIHYDATKKRLCIGEGYVEGVTPAMWRYEVSGKTVLRQWFSYRKANRQRPIIGDRRQPSRLGEIQPDHWITEYTTELINVLNVLGRLIELEPSQADLLERVCSGPTISGEALRAGGALAGPQDANQ